MPYKLNATNSDCYEGTTVLINKLGIRDEALLQKNEALITTYKAAELIQQPLIPDFGFNDYKNLHKKLFDMLYEWAGETRKISLSKIATTFTAPENINDSGERIFLRLKKLNYLTSLPRQEFICEIADLYHNLNILHPFREGNGRTERVFIVQLIRNAGHDIDYCGLNSDILMIGSIQAASGVMDTLLKFFEDNIIF